MPSIFKKSNYLFSFWLMACMLSFDLQAQLPNPRILNTAANGATTTFPVGTLDMNWYAARGNASGPTSAFIPTLVVGNCAPTFWYNSPFSNANWITYNYGTGCDHESQGCVDLFFRRFLELPDTTDCGFPIEADFCLSMDFFADNSVFEIKVNGQSNYTYPLNVDPYLYNGYQVETSVNLCQGWQPGLNTILVHIKSCPFAAGFLAQANTDYVDSILYAFSLSDSICAGENSFGYSSPGTYVDTLSLANGCTSVRTLNLSVVPVLANTITLDVCQNDSPYPQYTRSGVYIDTFQSSLGCDSIRTLNLSLRPSYEIRRPVIICAGESYFFNGQSLDAAGEYRHPLTTALGCDSTIILELSIAQGAFLGPDTTLCEASTYLLQGPTDGTRWFDGTLARTKKVTEPGSYWASFTDANGCEIRDTIVIGFPVKTFLPNAFSPNDDGINDYFEPLFSESGFLDFRLSIFDRWGHFIYTSAGGQGRGWDGTSQGQACPPGVYAYWLEVQSAFCKQLILKGDLTLLR